MSSVNKVIILGHLGKDPEVRYMTNGEAVANFSIATTEKWKDKTGEKQEKTEWHNITAYRKLAEIVAKYVKKGSLIYIEGKLQTRKWQDKEGKDRYTTEIIADQMQMIGGKREESGNPAEHHAGAVEQKNPSYGAAQPASKNDNFDDDIPF